MSRHAVVVGAGPAGIFAALELADLEGWDVTVLEKGPDLPERTCPARQEFCISCDSCDITSGWGGAGAFSDGKLTLTPDVGGWLDEYVGRERLVGLLAYADEQWLRFGAPREVHGPDEAEIGRLERKATLANMRLIPMRVRHIGTDRAPDVLASMRDHLEACGVHTRMGAEAVRVLTDTSGVTGVALAEGEELRADAVVLAPGREGSDWLAEEARRLGISLAHNAVDIGVRVEVPAPILEPLTDPLYEAKLLHYSERFDDQVRTFCMNPYGEVTTESYGDVITVNGHSYAERRTENTNFAVLVSQAFTEPFDDPISYGRSVARLANLLGEGIIVQRLGDLQAGRRSTPHRIDESIVAPTMPAATPGDLSFVLPYRLLEGVLDFLGAMERLVPGVASPHTLLYGVEVKFYSSRLELGPDLQTKVRGLYAAGDGAGVTRGLMQSSASGIVAARAATSST